MRIHKYVLRALFLSLSKDASLQINVTPNCRYYPYMSLYRGSEVNVGSFSMADWGEATHVLSMIKQADLLRHIAFDDFKFTIHPKLEQMVDEISKEIAQIDFDGKNREDYLIVDTKHMDAQARFITRVKDYVRSAY